MKEASVKMWSVHGTTSRELEFWDQVGLWEG